MGRKNHFFPSISLVFIILILFLIITNFPLLLLTTFFVIQFDYYYYSKKNIHKSYAYPLWAVKYTIFP